MLSEVESILAAEVAPHAQAMDRSTPILRRALRGLVDRGWISLRRPSAFGGPEWPEPDFRTFQELVASYSGALAFLQTQHQSAVALIAKGDNEKLKARFLPRMHRPSGLTGIGFSQLRRSGPPILQATPEAGGYRFDGALPWATGHAFFPHILIAAALEDGRSVFALAPFHDQSRDGGTIRYSAPMRLAAMESARTVSATLENWFVPDSDVVSIKPPNWIHRNDMINITLQGFFAVGCARAGIRIVEQAHAKSGAAHLERTVRSLLAEVEACRTGLAEAQAANSEETTDEKLALRAWAIELAMRCAHAGITVSSGAANMLTHPAQRVLREALVFTVSAQTGPIMAATLDRLARRGQQDPPN